ncbi:hypothetical protein HRF87_05720 [Bacillus sp. CRN 9]|nr:hypothetical protein [Bacillus sp. CRN 9]
MVSNYPIPLRKEFNVMKFSTVDTNKVLSLDDGVFYNECTGEYYENWIRMIIDCYKSGLTKEEILEGLDIENDGWLFWTTYC